MELLQQKRDVLTRMVNLQKIEMNANGQDTSIYQQRRREYAESSSGESWATFTTNNAKQPKIPAKQHFVPKLHI